MRVLLTNDDGIDQPGLVALERVFSGHETWVIAPSGHCSGTSQALGLYKELSIEQRSPRKWAVNGTPTDCVKLALSELMRNNPPDLVISGINPGPNLANNIYYSGTVAAATEAVFWGIPAFAASRDFGESPEFSVPAKIVKELVDSGLHLLLPENTLLNINIPCSLRNDIGGYSWTRTGRFAADIPFRIIEEGSKYAYQRFRAQQVHEPSGTDVHALSRGMVSLSLLQTNRTSSSSPPELSELGLEG